VEFEADAGLTQSRGRVGALLGVSSALLLVAAFRWAHHWGPLADAIVAAWAFTTLGALGVSTWSLFTSDGARRFAKLGLYLAVLSCLALVVVGIAAAAGFDTAGACGGG
jgi:hypothetical protein